MPYCHSEWMTKGLNTTRLNHVCIRETGHIGNHVCRCEPMPSADPTLQDRTELRYRVQE